MSSKKAAKTLIVVESSAKAKTIKGYLGRNYSVLSSMGHIVDLPKSRLAVDIENNFEPDYITVRGRGKILEALKKEASKSGEILIASDNDREGEAIAFNIYNVITNKYPNISIKRIIFNEITKPAIKSAISKPRTIDMNKVNAQKARRVLDRIVGYNLSPLLWEKLKKGLSAGRVQSASLKLICDREKEISEFVKEEYWKIKGIFLKGRKGFEAQFVKYKGKKLELSSKKDTDNLISVVSGESFKVSKLTEKERKKNPFPPYITSKLQQDASIRFGFTGERTMRVAQSLYEGVSIGRETVGLITYLRTDSTRVSASAIDDVRDYIGSNFGAKYLPSKPNFYKNKKGAQDAHEAIRPTSVLRAPKLLSSYLTPDALKLYTLIWNGFVASQMSSAKYKQIGVDIKGEDSIFRVVSSKLIFKGFLEIYGKVSAEGEGVVLPELKEGDKLKLKELLPSQHFTEPPPRYSESSIIKKLEESGVGRPSTYAPTLLTLVKRYYVSRKQKQIIPTELGILTNKLISEHFPNITDIRFTASIEAGLDKVEEESKSWLEILKPFYYDNFLPSLEKARVKMLNMKHLLDSETDKVCEKCGKPMLKKLGRYGYFLACSGFPGCRNSKPLPLAPCPVCATGSVVAKKAKRKTFYGCSNYPDCELSSWTEPVIDEVCSECGKTVFYKTASKSKKAYVCKNENCSYGKQEAKRSKGTKAKSKKKGGQRNLGKKKKISKAKGTNVSKPSKDGRRNITKAK